MVRVVACNRYVMYTIPYCIIIDYVGNCRHNAGYRPALQYFPDPSCKSFSFGLFFCLIRYEILRMLLIRFRFLLRPWRHLNMRIMKQHIIYPLPVKRIQDKIIHLRYASDSKLTRTAIFIQLPYLRIMSALCNTGSVIILEYPYIRPVGPHCILINNPGNGSAFASRLHFPQGDELIDHGSSGTAVTVVVSLLLVFHIHSFDRLCLYRKRRSCRMH